VQIYRNATTARPALRRQRAKRLPAVRPDLSSVFESESLTPLRRGFTRLRSARSSCIRNMPNERLAEVRYSGTHLGVFHVGVSA